ncbi:hypothetical protein HSR121_2031 [Halapricum desulfuricans]|uniref:Uncharacterized protein n=1 Tax=Halapricum desulfuricans TaxID=2841257 RepID=A0A897N540_9EURY|nr:hypothetical protein HSR121_2031 [Halapricum desulfuricans]
MTNTFTVRSNRTDYDDPSLIEFPAYAVAPTVWEPVESNESVVYWLE